MNWLNLAGGILGLALAHIIYGIPITTLIFRGYYAGIPNGMVEAARIDGASLLQTYVSIFLPLSIPAFVVVLI
jgi:glucose/mannose transport system permease protein